jgi:hypothetical protein
VRGLDAVPDPLTASDLFLSSEVSFIRNAVTAGPVFRAPADPYLIRLIVICQAFSDSSDFFTQYNPSMHNQRSGIIK